METKNLPNVGDVIMSSKFAYGYYEHKDKKLINIDGKTKKHPVTSYVSEDERVTVAAKSGKVPSKTRTVELGAHDPDRARAKFVIETANMEGGGTGHGPHDVYPNGWHIKARRLNNDGTYNPNGEVIRFFMTGWFGCMVDPKDVRVVGKMQMRFV